MKRRILSFVFVLLFVFSAFTFTGSAADGQIVSEDIDQTDVVTDLKKIGYDVDNMRKYPSAQYCRLLHFQEWGYRYDENTSEHALYLYVYNPSGKPINEDSYKNTVQLQGKRGSGAKTGFKKFTMDLISASTNEGYENLFLKFKVLVGSNFYRSLDKGMRRYEMSGIELHHVGDRNATDYHIGNMYACSGYLPYRGANNSPTNTLTTSVTDLLTLNLDLHEATWKTLSSDKSDSFKYEVFSVYFSVPNDVIDEYGDKKDATKGLYKIKGVYDEAKINGLVCDNLELFEQVIACLGKYYYEIPNLPFSFKAANYYEFNPLSSGGDRVTYIIPNIATALNAKNDYFNEFTDKEFKNFINSFQDKYGEYYYGLRKSSKEFEISSDDGDLGQQIFDEWSKTDKDSLSIWAYVFKFFGAVIDEVEYNINPIEAVTSDMFGVFTTDKEISNNFFIEESMVSDFKTYVKEAESRDETTYLLRFAVRDYCWDSDVNVIENDGGINGGLWDMYSGKQEYFQKTVFLDFDVMSLTWKDNSEQLRTIPVVCSPIHIYGSVDDPDDGMSAGDVIENIIQGIIPGGASGKVGDEKGLIKAAIEKIRNNLWIFSLAAGLLVFALLFWLGKKVKWLFEPFIALWKGTKKLFKGMKDRGKKRKEKRKQKKKEKEKEERKKE